MSDITHISSDVVISVYKEDAWVWTILLLLLMVRAVTTVELYLPEHRMSTGIMFLHQTQSLCRLKIESVFWKVSPWCIWVSLKGVGIPYIFQIPHQISENMDRITMKHRRAFEGMSKCFTYLKFQTRPVVIRVWSIQWHFRCVEILYNLDSRIFWEPALNLGFMNGTIFAFTTTVQFQ